MPIKPINEKIMWFLVGISFKNKIEPRIIRSGVTKEIDTTSESEADLKARKKDVKANIFRKALTIWRYW